MKTTINTVVMLLLLAFVVIDYAKTLREHTVVLAFPESLGDGSGVVVLDANGKPVHFSTIAEAIKFQQRGAK